MKPEPPKLPAALLQQTRFVKLGSSQIPALLAHPDWERPAPVVIWMHGRTVSKELDNGRYLRWIRAGIAACAIDLPMHGERWVESGDDPRNTLDVIAQMVSEIDEVVEAIAHPMFLGVFDLDRLGIGGMSAGGMCTLRRLTMPGGHPFRCAAVESTAGNMHMLYRTDARQHPHAPPWPQPEDKVAAIDPMTHLENWSPTALLALHSRADRTVPVGCIETFIDAVRPRNAGRETTLHTWDVTGAPDEHNGFGRVAAEAKSLQVEFLVRHLAP